MKIENLKFRAWHKDLEDMTYSFNGYSLDKFIWKILTYPDMYQLMQFTGLKDKNGKDIYEGDIIKCVEDDDLREIVFTAGAFSAYERGSKTYCTLHHYGTPLIEIVGNIYENTYLFTISKVEDVIVKNSDNVYCKRSDCNNLKHKDNIYCLEHLYEHKMSGY